MKSASGSLLLRLLDSFTPKQICYVCLLVTISGAVLGSTYAVRSFASSERMDRVEKQVSRIEVRLLEREIFDRVAQMCAAVKAEQPARIYRERLQEALRAYRELTGQDFVLPACNEL